MSFTRYLVVACTALLAASCGGPSNVSRVSGKVTLAGQPLADATVIFQPAKEGGSSALGKTDSSGAYTLGYAAGVSGAEQGENRVSISTYDAGDSDAEPPRPAVPEKVPAKYNVKSELKADVKAGTNAPFNWDLEAGGPIVDPENAGPAREDRCE